MQAVVFGPAVHGYMRFAQADDRGETAGEKLWYTSPRLVGRVPG